MLANIVRENKVASEIYSQYSIMSDTTKKGRLKLNIRKALDTYFGPDGNPVEKIKNGGIELHKTPDDAENMQLADPDAPPVIRFKTRHVGAAV